MTDMIIDLWPDDLVPDEMGAPVRLLKQQAKLLGQKMKNMVTGEVATSIHKDDENARSLVHTFSIVTPSLRDYKYSLFYVEHGIPFYPLEIWSNTDRKGTMCQNEEEFMRKLREIFASEETRRVISALIAQTKN